MGLDRGNIYGADSPAVVENTRIRSVMKADGVNIKLTKLADHVVQQIMEYKKYGFEIIGIIGANRSPNCGVETTSDNNTEIRGMGLFIEKISSLLLQEKNFYPHGGYKMYRQSARKTSADDAHGRAMHIMRPKKFG